MSTSGKRLLSHLFLSISERSSFSHILRHTNGHSKWSATVDRHPISCFSLMDIQDKRWEGTGCNESLTRYKPLHTSWRQLFPQIPPFFPCTRLLTRSLTSLAAIVAQKNPFLRETQPFEGPKEKDPFAFLGSFQRKCLPSFKFVRSFFYLPYRSYKTCHWVDECIVLLLLTCLRLYGFAVSMFGEGKGRRGRNPWFKKGKEKKKRLDQYHVTYVTVNCYSLLELIKI